MKKRYLKLVRSAFRALRHRRLRHRSWWRALTKPLFARTLWVPCRDTVANGLAIGLFFSMIPMIPQAIISAIIAMRAKANVPFAMAACFVSNPITNLPIWAAQVKLGAWLYHFLPIPEDFLPGHFTVPGVGLVSAATILLGVVASGVVLALISYPLVHLFSALMPHHLPVLRRKAVRTAVMYSTGWFALRYAVWYAMRP